jgi:hypothetical protein
MHGLELTLGDDILIGLLLVLIKSFIKPSRIEGQILLMLIPIILQVVRKSHPESLHFVSKAENQFKILRDKIKGDKMTLG